MNNELNFPPINQLEKRKGIFSVESYSRFTKIYDAQDVVWQGKRYMIMRQSHQELNLSDENYTGPNYIKISSPGNVGYRATEIPVDSIFLGSIDLSIDNIGSDSTQYIIIINQIIERLGQSKINEWEKENETEFPLAYSPSTRMLYGFF